MSQTLTFPLPPNLANHNHGKMKPGPKPKAPAEKFWAKVKKGEGCWEWLATCLPNGYGQFHPAVGVPTTLAHRFSYTLNVGPIPDGMYVCHTCDNPGCVRPDHLFLGSASDNMRDMVEKDRHGARPQRFCKRGHEMTPENSRVGKQRRCRECHLAQFRDWYRRTKGTP